MTTDVARSLASAALIAVATLGLNAAPAVVAPAAAAAFASGEICPGDHLLFPDGRTATVDASCMVVMDVGSPKQRFGQAMTIEVALELGAMKVG